MERKTLVSLFAGAGGLDLGLEMAGFETVVANEYASHTCETLRQNKSLSGLVGSELGPFIESVKMQRAYKLSSKDVQEKLTERLREKDSSRFLARATVVQADIRMLSARDILTAAGLSDQESVFCIAGGPPCQPFSRAGKRRAVDDAKNGDLFFHFVRMVDEIRPKWFIFENVKGLVLTKTDVVYCKCPHCGYFGTVSFPDRVNLVQGEEIHPLCPECSAKNSMEISQKFIAGGSLEIILSEFRRLGYSCQHKVLNAADYGVPQSRERLFIVGSRDGLSIDWPIPTHSDCRPSFQASLFDDASISSKPWVSLYDAIWKNGHHQYGQLDKNRAVLWVKNVVRPHDEPVTWSLDRVSPTIGAHQGAKLALAPYGVPEEQLARQQWHTKGNRQGNSKPVKVEHAYLTDSELLELQTFPRWWYLHGTRMERAFQIGNAVPPQLARVVGKAVIEAQKKADL